LKSEATPDEGVVDCGVYRMETYVCDSCGWVYGPEEGLPELGIVPGTRFEDLPENFVCPEGGAGKDQFSPAAP